MKSVEMFTDGACRGNPGPGGWGVLLRFVPATDGEERQLFGGQWETTNNRMELQAVIEGFTALQDPCRIALTTDSRYVQQGFTEWLSQWKRRNWRTAAGKAVRNQDLWKALDELAGRHRVEWHWTKGHSGHEGNDIADKLANQGIDDMVGEIVLCKNAGSSWI